MKLSKKSRYGLRALVDLSVSSSNGHVALCNIAERNGISPQYLEQAFASLRRAGIVKGIKGSQGGYLLNRTPDKITVASILEALEGSYRLEDEEPETAGDGISRGISASIQKLVIDQVNEKMDDLLQNLTLEDLQQAYLEHAAADQDMYYI
jgi:Rrf2 family protein